MGLSLQTRFASDILFDFGVDLAMFDSCARVKNVLIILLATGYTEGYI